VCILGFKSNFSGCSFVQLGTVSFFSFLQRSFAFLVLNFFFTFPFVSAIPSLPSAVDDVALTNPSGLFAFHVPFGNF